MTNMMLYRAFSSLKSEGTRYSITYIIGYLFCMLQIVMTQRANTEIGTTYGYIGNTTTLRCDLSNIYNQDSIIWYRPDREIYLSYDENIYGDVPADIRSRLSVSCERGFFKDTCLLTINNLTSDDNGTYACGYEPGIYTELTTGYLVVSNLPSEESPICEILKSSGDGGYVATERVSVDDDVILSCQAGNDVIRSSLVWKRDNVTLSMPAQIVSLQQQIAVSDDDIGVEFICVMTHPALNEPRSCSVTLLPVLLTSTIPLASSATPFSSDLYTTLVSTEGIVSDGVPRTKQQIDSLTLGIVITIIFILVIVFILVLIWRQMKSKSPILTTPDYGLTIDRNSSITPDYAAVNALDSIDKALELKMAVASEDHTSSVQVNDKQGSFPVYAKPNKKKGLNDANLEADSAQYDNLAFTHHQNITEEDSSNNKKLNNDTNLTAESSYDNLPHHQSKNNPVDDTSKDGLVYAELDLPVISNSELPSRTNRDTIYADIEGTL